MTAVPSGQKPSLLKRSTEGALLTVLQIGLGYSLRLASNLILTRLLAPEAFGLVAFAMTAATAFALLSDIGISRSIVREPDGDQTEFLRTAWTAKILRTGVIGSCTLAAALIAAILAPGLAPPGTVYADPDLPAIIAATAILTFISGWESTAVDLAQRRINYRRMIVVQTSVQLVQITATAIAAYAIGTVWALVIGMTVATLASLVASHLAYPGPRMSLRLDREITSRLWTFGRWIMLSSGLTFLQRNMDKLALGALLSSTSFGHYTIAAIWTDAGRGILQALISRIAFPAFSEVAIERRSDLLLLFRRLQIAVDAAVWGCFAVIAIGGQWLISLLYPDTYSEAGTYLTLLSLTCLAQRFDLFNELLTALGDSRALAVASALRTIGLAAAMVLGWHVAGVNGLVIASALHPIVAAPFLLWKAHRHLPGLRLTQDILSLIAIAGAGVVFLLQA